MKRKQFTLGVLPLLLAVAAFCSAEPASPTPAVAAKGGFTLADLQAQIPQNTEGAFLIEIPMILSIAADPEVQALLSGQAVETTAQIMPETLSGAAGGHPRIFRTQLLCCASHARQCSVEIKLPENAPAVKEMTWVKLTGTLSYRREERKMVPVFIVKELKETMEPRNPLLN
jgi:hypothetical protein